MLMEFPYDPGADRVIYLSIHSYHEKNKYIGVCVAASFRINGFITIWAYTP